MQEHIKHTRLPFRCGAGEASVNIRTGRLTFNHPDVCIGEGSNGTVISVAHIFNPEIPFFDATPGMGNGWKLNVQHYLIPNAENDGSDSDKFTYIDETGHSHRLDTYHAASRFYYAEGSNLILQILDWRCRDGEGCRYVIIDDAGNQLYFDSVGRLRSIVLAQNPQAEQVFEYTEDKLTAIYDARNPSQIVTLDYDGNRLSKITYEETVSGAVGEAAGESVSESDNETRNESIDEAVGGSVSDADVEAGDEPVRLIRTLCYGYDERGNLAGIIRKTLDTVQKTETVESVACFEYDLDRDIGFFANPLYPLTKAVDGKDNSALQFDYAGETCEGVYRLQKVTSGYCAVMTESGASDPYGYGYGDGGELTPEITGCPNFIVSAMGGTNVQAWTEFIRSDEEDNWLGAGYCAVTVESDKGAVTDYFFNPEGLMTDLLERPLNGARQK